MKFKLYREEQTPMWELDNFFGVPHYTTEYLDWNDMEFTLESIPHNYERDKEWNQNISVSIKEWWEETDGGGRNRQYRENGRRCVRPEDRETPEERSLKRSKGMNSHWNSEEGERQKELYRERNRNRIQSIVDSVEHTPVIGRHSVIFFGKVFSSIREVNRLTGCDRNFIKRNSEPYRD